jgi:hypothetical protein
MRRLSVLSTTHQAPPRPAGPAGEDLEKGQRAASDAACSGFPAHRPRRARRPISAHSDSITTRYWPRRKFTFSAQRGGQHGRAASAQLLAAREPGLQRSWQRDSSEQHSEQIGAA